MTKNKENVSIYLSNDFKKTCKTHCNLNHFTNKIISRFILDCQQTEFRFVLSKRGTRQIFYEGNTFTPNDKKTGGKRDWKCSLYYKQSCRARLTTFTSENNETTVRLISNHSHPNVYSTKKSLELLFNYR